MSDLNNIQYFYRQLNGKVYKMSLKIYNLKKKYQFVLPSNIVDRIEIINDLDSYYPHFILNFTDTAGQYTNKAMQTGQEFSISIIPPDNSQSKRKK